MTPFTSTTPGQVIEARGRVGFMGGRVRLDLTESVEKTTSPFGISLLAVSAVPTPMRPPSLALSANTEALEGQLVSIANVSRVSGTFPTTPQSLDAFVTVSDGTGNFSLKIDHDTDIDGFMPGATFDVIGIVQQDDYLRPFDAGYDLAPRSAVDLGATAAATAAAADDRRGARRRASPTPTVIRRATRFPICWDTSSRFAAR